MARYFYDHSVGTDVVRDKAGVVCRDDKAAVHNGQIALSALLLRYAHVLPWQHFELIIRREDGAHIGRMGMTLVVETQNPATVAAIASARESQQNARTKDNRL